tara:strand:+ start:559 stop:909 length:351 start_codon:yes stop_codon:yes gene_type:complete
MKIQLRDILKEMAGGYNITPDPNNKSYELDGTIQKVVTIYNRAVEKALRGGYSKLNPSDFEYDRHNCIRSVNANAGISAQNANNMDPNAEKIITNALKRVGYEMDIDNEGLVFLPI